MPGFLPILLRAGLRPEKHLPLCLFEVTAHRICLATTRDNEENCSVIDSIAVPNSEESTGVTTFASEACTKETVLGAVYTGSALLKRQEEFQNLTRYFERPRIIENLTLTPNVRQREVKYPITTALLFNTYFPSGGDRLLGVYGLRFDIVFTLQIATTPFHQGLVNLCWQYEESVTTNAAKPWDRALYPNTSTNIPHVLADLAETTMVQLRVPFLNTSEFRLTNDSSIYGSLSLVYVLPVQYAVTNTSPTVNLYIHLENLEFYGAAAENTTTVTLQSGKPMNKEFEQDAYPFSSSLSSMSKSLRFLALGVPSISSIAGPLSWFTQKAAGAVRAFGYAKPIIQEPPKRVYDAKHVYEVNTDLPSASTTLGPYMSNQVGVHPSFAASDVDEMSLSFVLSQWGQVFVGSLSTANAVNDLVYATPLCPMCFWFRAPVATTDVGNLRPPEVAPTDTNAIIPTHVMSVANCFRLFKGGFVFRFTFAKTKFHAGRVLVSYTPQFGDFNPSASTTVVGVPTTRSLVAPQPFGYSKVFDLRDSSVFEFEVPFVSGTPYIRTFSTSGTLAMRVLDPLLAPETVSTTVPFLVEVKGANDLEFAVPRAPLYFARPCGVVHLQSGQVVSTIKPQASEMCVGEAVSSVKTLITIPFVGKSVDVAAAALRAYPTIPWWWYPQQDTTLPAIAARSGSFSLGGYWGTHYLYARGGTEYHCYAETGEWVVNSFPTDFNDVSANATVLKGSGASNPTVVNPEGHVHIRVPYYSQFARSLTTYMNDILFTSNGYSSSSSVPGAEYAGLFGLGKLKFTHRSTAAVPAIVTRAAADDAMLGHYMGPVPLGLPSSTPGTGSYDPDLN